MEVVVVPSADGVTVPVDAIAAAIDHRTAEGATSHVYFATGAIQDIAAVAEAARPGHVWLSPFFHNIAADHDRAIDRIAALSAH